MKKFRPERIKRRVEWGFEKITIPLEHKIITNRWDTWWIWDLLTDEKSMLPKALQQDERDRSVTILRHADSLDIYVDGVWHRILQWYIVDPLIFSIEDPKEFLCELFDDLLNITFTEGMPVHG